jgi:sodium transport system permease protein
MSIASDLVAGEKEKNTLETLLISPARRTLIVLGKFLALATICLLSAMSSLIGLALVAKLHLPGTEEIMKNGLGVSPMAFLITLIVLLPLVSLFASILIAISSCARNPREAQTYLSLCSFVVIMPAMFSQFLGLTDASKELWINAIPILNTANSIRTALLGKADAVAVAITVAVSLALALVALRITVHLFNREEVLVRV